MGLNNSVVDYRDMLSSNPTPKDLLLAKARFNLLERRLRNKGYDPTLSNCVLITKDNSNAIKKAYDLLCNEK